MDKTTDPVSATPTAPVKITSNKCYEDHRSADGQNVSKPSSPQTFAWDKYQLKDEIKNLLETKTSQIRDYLEWYWCEHGSLNNVISQVDVDTTEPTKTIFTLTVGKLPCGCKGHLRLCHLHTTIPAQLELLTNFTPMPFRKRKVLEVGVDEVGRGCLFGPVTAGAVVWPPDLDDETSRRLVKDSKVLTEAQREQAYEYILEHAVSWGIASLDHNEIDRTNILQASIKAMHMAIDETYIAPEHVIADGKYFKFYMDNEGESISHTTVVSGDSKYYSIAAASIIAKVTRDRAMVELVKRHPELEVYGIASNKGYGAKVHTDAIKSHGLTQWHRKSFKPCREALGK